MSGRDPNGPSHFFCLNRDRAQQYVNVQLLSAKLFLTNACAIPANVYNGARDQGLTDTGGFEDLV